MKAVAIGLVLAVISMAVLPLAAAPLVISRLPGQFAFGGESEQPSPSTTPTTPPRSSTTPSPAPTGTNSPPATNVSFDIAVINVSGSGLSQTVTARITNTGAIDAHNTWIKVELFSQGQRIKLDGQDYMRVDIGTLQAKASVTRQATITVSLLDGLMIASSGARFALTVYSDEGTQTLFYDYKP